MQNSKLQVKHTSEKTPSSQWDIERQLQFARWINTDYVQMNTN